MTKQNYFQENPAINRPTFLQDKIGSRFNYSIIVPSLFTGSREMERDNLQVVLGYGTAADLAVLLVRAAARRVCKIFSYLRFLV